MNGVYIMAESGTELAAHLQPFLRSAGVELAEETVSRAVPHVKERMQVLADAVPLLRFLGAEVEPDEESRLLLAGEEAQRVLEASLNALADLEPFEEAGIEAALRSVVEQLGMKARVAFQPIRVAITGSKVSPPLFASLELLGRDRTLERLRKALGRP
jgi:glutamyl-tRNA synthetase